jgi:hypothetical protein
MAAPLPSTDFACQYACLTQLLFHLHSGVGTAAPPGSALAELLNAIPCLAPNDRRVIEASLKTLPAPGDGPGHPGLQPLVPGENHSVYLQTQGPLEQTFSPFLLHDTFVVDISSELRGQPLSLLSQAPISFETSLGQCFILYLQANDTSLAFVEACVRDVGPLELVSSGEATLLGRPIWEFSDGLRTWHLWLDDPLKPIDPDCMGTFQQHLLNFLCCRAKMEFAARASRRAFHAGLNHYQFIEAQAAQIALLERERQQPLYQTSTPLGPLEPGKPPNQAEQLKRIALLEDHLTVLPQLGLQLARCERDITTHRLTFTTNAFNALQASKALLQKGDTFQKSFLEQDCPTWRSQMDHDLQVLSSGQYYAEQLINSLRAIVALDSQKLQINLEGEEKLRDRILQHTIFFVGAALSISGLAAATRPRPAAKLLSTYFPHHKPNMPAEWLWFGDITIHFFIGLSAALLFLLVWLAWGKRPMASRQSRQK